jgi:NADPH:quinone reductase-like Zn-dependent oxidoreductase
LDSIELADVADPVPGTGEVLVRVRAAGLNRADLAARAGVRRTGPEWAEARAPFVGGMELAGEVLAVGDGVSTWRPGDRVMGRGAGYAELAAVRGQRLLPVPDELAWPEAGGFPIALTTAHEALVTCGHLETGQTVVVNAATSGVGVVAVQMAAALGARTVIAVSRSTEKLRMLEEFVGTLSGRLITVSGDFVDPVRECTDGHGADLIIDHVGASALQDNLVVARNGGRIVQVGRLGGKVATIDLDQLASKRLELVGLAFRSRTGPELDAVVARCVASLGPRLSGIRPRIAETFRLSDVLKAQERLAQNNHVGKLVLVVAPEDGVRATGR